MRFTYLALPSRRPIPPLGGSRVRHRPVIPVQLIGPNGSRLLGANIDSGSDDILFPLHLARHLGIDLNNAAEGEAQSIGGPAIRYLYASVTLRVADGSEACEWTSIAGFHRVTATVGHSRPRWLSRVFRYATPRPPARGGAFAQRVIHRPANVPLAARSLRTPKPRFRCD
jgi:hypothetical protein